MLANLYKSIHPKMNMSNFHCKKKIVLQKQLHIENLKNDIQKGKNIIYIDFYTTKLLSTLDKTLRLSSLLASFFSYL